MQGPLLDRVVSFVQLSFGCALVYSDVGVVGMALRPMCLHSPHHAWCGSLCLLIHECVLELKASPESAVQALLGILGLLSVRAYIYIYIYETSNGYPVSAC